MHAGKDAREISHLVRGKQTRCHGETTQAALMSPLNDLCAMRNMKKSRYKKIGILGGVGPESTMVYYGHIVHEHYRQNGNLDYPEILILSVGYQTYEKLLCQGQWNIVAAKVTQGLKSLRRAGAEYGLIACNTLHIVFDQVRIGSPIPLISIVEATAESVERHRIKTVGLLGTSFTLDSGIYQKKLEKRGIATLVPSAEDGRFVDEVIRRELIPGIIMAKSRRRFIRIIDRMAASGAEGVVLGCTEIPLLVRQRDCQTRLFDTALIHVQKALAYSLGLSDG